VDTEEIEAEEGEMVLGEVMAVIMTVAGILTGGTWAMVGVEIHIAVLQEEIPLISSTPAILINDRQHLRILSKDTSSLRLILMTNDNPISNLSLMGAMGVHHMAPITTTVIRLAEVALHLPEVGVKDHMDQVDTPITEVVTETILPDTAIRRATVAHPHPQIADILVEVVMVVAVITAVDTDQVPLPRITQISSLMVMQEVTGEIEAGDVEGGIDLLVKPDLLRYSSSYIVLIIRT